MDRGRDQCFVRLGSPGDWSRVGGGGWVRNQRSFLSKMMPELPFKRQVGVPREDCRVCGGGMENSR